MATKKHIPPITAVKQEAIMHARRIIIIPLVIIVAALLSGCTQGNIRIHGTGSNQGTDGIQGVGDMVSRDFQTGDFEIISINVPFVVIWNESPQTSVTVEMQENLFGQLLINVRDGILLVESLEPFDVSSPNIPRIYITSQNLIELSSDIAIFTEGWDTVKADIFAIDLTGAAVIDIPLDVDTLLVYVDEAGASLTFSGNADYASYVVEGGVTISAFDLQTADTRVEFTGAGSIEVNASNTLDVSIVGAGTVRHKGNPTVTQSITGLGSVTSAD